MFRETALKAILKLDSAGVLDLWAKMGKHPHRMTGIAMEELMEEMILWEETGHHEVWAVPCRQLFAFSLPVVVQVVPDDPHANIGKWASKVVEEGDAVAVEAPDDRLSVPLYEPTVSDGLLSTMSLTFGSSGSAVKPLSRK